MVFHWPIQEERRLKCRYPLDLKLRFRCCADGSHFSGAGRAVNLSSGGVLVASNHAVSVGELVEMSIEWPLLLHDRVPLQLFAVGRVLRREISHFAASFERHEFRIAKSSNQS
jgi:PilZ domain